MSLCHRVASVFCRLSTIHKKWFSSLNSYPISIMSGLFERACALTFLADYRNCNYKLTYDLIKTQLGRSVHKKCILSFNSHPTSIPFGLFQRSRACALNFADLRNFNY